MVSHKIKLISKYQEDDVPIAKIVDYFHFSGIHYYDM